MMEKAVIGGERVGRMSEVSGGWWGGGGGMWSRHTFSLTRLEPTRTGVGSPGAKMDSGGGEEAGTRGLKEGRDGEERVREGGIRGRPEWNRERKARKVKVSAGSSGDRLRRRQGHSTPTSLVPLCLALLNCTFIATSMAG